jgi:hypothetical protein
VISRKHLIALLDRIDAIGNEHATVVGSRAELEALTDDQLAAGAKAVLEHLVLETDFWPLQGVVEDRALPRNTGPTNMIRGFFLGALWERDRRPLPIAAPIEAMATAMCEAEGDVPWDVQEDHRKENYRRLAEAAAAAVPAPPVTSNSSLTIAELVDAFAEGTLCPAAADTIRALVREKEDS